MLRPRLHPPLFADVENGFLQVFVHYMFHFTVSPEWSVKMVSRWPNILAALVLFVANPVYAKEMGDQAPTLHLQSSAGEATDQSAFSIGGVRQTATSTFTLSEHGLWQRAAAVSADRPSTNQGQPNAQQPVGPSTLPRAKQSSFRRSAWLPWVYAAENRQGLPLGLLDALIWTESRYNPSAQSHAGAVGLAQLMPTTARELGVGNRFDPIASIDGGARYLKRMIERFGSLHLGIAAYNAGPGAVERARGIPANRETPGYVRNVLERWGLM
jgi:soluble lytic murein transglycosylase-like protein